MKRFLIFTSKLLLLTFVMLFVLDIVYTQVYLHDVSRNKVAQVYNGKGTYYDVVILGSSRANNHFVAPMFEDKGLKTFNYGMSGAHLFEASLLFKLMLEKGDTIKNVILEADLNLSSDHQAESSAAGFLPYLHNSETVKKHFEQEDNFMELYYIPFYRYVKYDNRIGIREMFFTGIHKRSKLLNNYGYYPLGKKENANMKNDLTNLKPLVNNRYYEEIKMLCKAKGINFIAVMTPMCENTNGINYFDKVKVVYPEIYNYENVVQGDQYFSSCGHMNDTGAKLFTAKIINDFFNK